MQHAKKKGLTCRSQMKEDRSELTEKKDHWFGEAIERDLRAVFGVHSQNAAFWHSCPLDRMFVHVWAVLVRNPVAGLDPSCLWSNAVAFNFRA